MKYQAADGLKIYRVFAVLLFLCWNGHASGTDKDPELDQLRAGAAAHLDGLKPAQIQRSPAPGLYEVQDGMAFGYLTSDGRYLIQGDLIDLETGVVITEARRNAYRARRVSELAESAIVFVPAKKDKERYRVSVFVDVDCRYCREFHQEVAALNRAGIAVQYLFYPRKGRRSEGFKFAERAYCAKDEVRALDQMLQGQKATGRTKKHCTSPVAEQLAVALELEVRGTPMIVLPDGSVIYGYIAAKTLVEILDGTLDDNAVVH